MNRKKTILITLGCMIVAGIGLIAAAPHIKDRIVFRQWQSSMSPEWRERVTWKHYQDWKTVRIMFPAEALKATPFTTATQAASRLFAEKWEPLKEKGNALAEKTIKMEKPLEYPSLKEEIAAMQDLLAAFEALVRRPDYTVMALPLGRPQTPRGYPIGAHFSGLRPCAQMLSLRALLAAQEGRMEQAMKDTETCVRAGWASPYDTLVGQLLGVNACAIGSHAWSRIVKDCQNAALLRQALKVQGELAGGLDFLADWSIPLNLLVEIANIREIIRRGGPFQFQGFTEHDLVLIKNWEASVAYMEKVTLPAMKDDPEQARDVKNWIRDEKVEIAKFGGPGGGILKPFRRFFGRLEEPTRFILSKSYNRKGDEGDRARQMFAQVRLETARKLHALEHGKPPARDADLVPEYFEQLPTN